MGRIPNQISTASSVHPAPLVALDVSCVQCKQPCGQSIHSSPCLSCLVSWNVMAMCWQRQVMSILDVDQEEAIATFLVAGRTQEALLLRLGRLLQRAQTTQIRTCILYVVSGDSMKNSLLNQDITREHKLLQDVTKNGCCSSWQGGLVSQPPCQTCCRCAHNHTQCVQYSSERCPKQMLRQCPQQTHPGPHVCRV